MCFCPTFGFFNKKSLLKSLCAQQKKLSLLTRVCSLAIFTANETITNLTQYELSQEESEIFTTFEKIHCSVINNLKSEETKIQMKSHFSYLANSYFYKYKPSPHILRQHRV